MGEGGGKSSVKTQNQIWYRAISNTLKMETEAFIETSEKLHNLMLPSAPQTFTECCRREQLLGLEVTWGCKMQTSSGYLICLSFHVGTQRPYNCVPVQRILSHSEGQTVCRFYRTGRGITIQLQYTARYSYSTQQPDRPLYVALHLGCCF